MFFIPCVSVSGEYGADGNDWVFFDFSLFLYAILCLFLNVRSERVGGCTFFFLPHDSRAFRREGVEGGEGSKWCSVDTEGEKERKKERKQDRCLVEKKKRKDVLRRFFKSG